VSENQHEPLRATGVFSAFHPDGGLRVLDRGFVRLDGALADDLSVVNSARVSFASKSEFERIPLGRDYPEVPDPLSQYVRDFHSGIVSEWKLNNKDKGLIKFLMKNKHGTPFEHNMFRFHIKAPIFVFREWQRHRISSYNEWSARYSQLEPEFYIPEYKNIRQQEGKPGQYSFTPLEGDVAKWYRYNLTTSSRQSYEYYQKAIDGGVAKEQARLFLPVNIYSQMYWTVNARSLMNFLSLRNSDHAMFEIREYAKVVEEIFTEHMPVTVAAFISNARIAP
jgi:thymidylate synthase (FAD)